MRSRDAPTALAGYTGLFIAERLINWVESMSNDKAAEGILSCKTSELQQGASIAEPLSFALSQQAFGWKKVVSVWLNSLQVCLYTDMLIEPKRMVNDNNSDSKDLSISSNFRSGSYHILFTKLMKMGQPQKLSFFKPLNLRGLWFFNKWKKVFLIQKDLLCIRKDSNPQPPEPKSGILSSWTTDALFKNSSQI